MRAEAAGLALAASLVAAQAVAQAPPRAATCTACHGEDGNAPVPGFPSIAGQPRLFIDNQLLMMREGLRDVPAMKPVLEGMTDDEIAALARHFAAQRPRVAAGVVAQPALQQRGAALSQRANCGSCHLPDYRGQNQVPRLSAQNEAYLLQSMKEFRDHPGPGRDTIMAATLAGMTDADLGALAHYLATKQP
ncbi:c-type cytochrome [Aquabacterium sp. J223]|uniref:c-type cytochrome n=1 Tax=Aquabacterium sp. J223 TaxID=2898431 RepID=UPI0021ADED7A|nr:c-type cytochrome [Aquabacterium sp. J223]UUX97182.1 c-type cytochrome [Aquabacterium sp. J223]